MNWTKTCIAAALAAASATVALPAAAATSLGTLGAGYTVFGNGFDHSTTSFTDYYTFNIVGSSVVSGGTIEWDLGSWLNVDIKSITLTGGSILGSLTDTTMGDGFKFDGLGAGSYTMAVNGAVGGLLGGFYSGKIHATSTVAAPVPEPEDLALTLAGLLSVGWMVRRTQARQR